MHKGALLLPTAQPSHPPAGRSECMHDVWSMLAYLLAAALGVDAKRK